LHEIAERMDIRLDPSLPERRGVGRRLRAARTSTAGAFFLTGLVFATWAARIPARKSELGLTDVQLAAAFTGLNAGAVLGLQLGAVVVSRIGSRRALTLGLPAFALMLLPLAHASNLWVLTVTLALSAAVNSVVDVAINDHGVGLQRHYGRSLLSGLHAMHSVGGMVGAGLAALAEAAALTVGTHFVLVALGAVIMAGRASRRLLSPTDLHGHCGRPDPGHTVRQQLMSGWTGRLVLLGGLAFVYTLAEASALDWSAVLLRDARDAAASTAAAALVVFLASISVGRLLGDRAIDRWGSAAVFRTGAVLAGCGLATGLLLGTVGSAMAGLALFGLGLATLVPISFSAASNAADLPVPVAVARVSTVGYLGSFTAPGLIGALTHLTDLATAMLVPAIIVGVTALAARTVAIRRANRSSGAAVDAVR
jgi:MFS family permease